MSSPEAIALFSAQVNRGCAVVLQLMHKAMLHTQRRSVDSCESTRSRLMNLLQFGQYILFVASSSISLDNRT